MTSYAFTGPTSITFADRDLVTKLVGALESPTKIITGCAIGWDTAVALAAASIYGDDVEHCLYVPGARWHNKHIAGAIREYGVEPTVIQCPDKNSAAETYRHRNERMVDDCQRLVAGVRSKQFYRSGEWMTINIARSRRAIPIQLVLLGEREERRDDQPR